VEAWGRDSGRDLGCSAFLATGERHCY